MKCKIISSRTTKISPSRHAGNYGEILMVGDGKLNLSGNSNDNAGTMQVVRNFEEAIRAIFCRAMRLAFL